MVSIGTESVRTAEVLNACLSTVRTETVLSQVQKLDRASCF